jgi:hypothetical protein
MMVDLVVAAPGAALGALHLRLGKEVLAAAAQLREPTMVAAVVVAKAAPAQTELAALAAMEALANPVQFLEARSLMLLVVEVVAMWMLAPAVQALAAMVEVKLPTVQTLPQQIEAAVVVVAAVGLPPLVTTAGMEALAL